jgi:hypothetical protein
LLEITFWPDSKPSLSFMPHGIAQKLYIVQLLLLLWVLRCLVSLSLRQNAIAHKSQLYGLTSACVLEWRVSSAFEKNDL